jgi:GNAT superfamily N-acetyltransferase
MSVVEFSAADIAIVRGMPSNFSEQFGKHSERPGFVSGEAGKLRTDLQTFFENYSSAKSCVVRAVLKKAGICIAGLVVDGTTRPDAQFRWFFLEGEARGKNIGRRIADEALSFVIESGFA